MPQVERPVAGRPDLTPPLLEKDGKAATGRFGPDLTFLAIPFFLSRSVPFRDGFVVSLEARLRRHGRKRVSVPNEKFFFLIRCEQPSA